MLEFRGDLVGRGSVPWGWLGWWDRSWELVVVVLATPHGDNQLESEAQT